ncbi:hypothetical protein BMG03_01150 [Thioclava nitratireducens]|uniref:Flagellar biosynthesis protein n=1 Tax=Thioclava nitratireducens TaxID=1915078 RepID=A0ABM6ICW2_9RHOB|nr:hypothetical protein [Thioclava nitratireducens]AQS46562.1 hypothetical protein BMG03_01150 [Thioclava nitratireducens]
MGQRLKLESFEPKASEAGEIALDPAELEETKLAAFETGYQAGWDDAVAAQNVETARLHGDLGRNLQALGFTYNEARQHMLGALEPLLLEICGKLLPELARASLSAVVAEQLMPIAGDLCARPITVVGNPTALPQIQEALAPRADLPLAFVAEPSLGEGQVYLRFADTETRVDLDAVIAAISRAVTTYFTATAKDKPDE